MSLTARFLCNKLGEPEQTSVGAGAVVGKPASCRAETERDALKRVGTLEAGFAPRGTTWVPPTTWKPPYPEAWSQTYP